MACGVACPEQKNLAGKAGALNRQERGSMPASIEKQKVQGQIGKHAAVSALQRHAFSSKTRFVRAVKIEIQNCIRQTTGKKYYKKIPENR